MSFAYWFFTFVVLGTFPAVFYLVQVYGFSRLPDMNVSPARAAILWSVVGIISCIFAWTCVWGGVGAVLAWIFEILVMGLICVLTFKNSETAKILDKFKSLVGL